MTKQRNVNGHNYLKRLNLDNKKIFQCLQLVNSAPELLGYMKQTGLRMLGSSANSMQAIHVRVITKYYSSLALCGTETGLRGNERLEWLPRAMRKCLYLGSGHLPLSFSSWMYFLSTSWHRSSSDVTASWVMLPSPSLAKHDQWRHDNNNS